jgi:NADP-dependent 3-hydroxy acid dehydrogenase YdfG
MKQIIVISGASSGFGALTARALARAGHTVYASSRGSQEVRQGQQRNLKKLRAAGKVKSSSL